jgi:hypothetical protein
MHNRPAKEKFRVRECGNEFLFLLLQLKKRMKMKKFVY